MSRTDNLTWHARAAVDAQTAALAHKTNGRLRWLADDPDCPDYMRMAALAEELGEVGRALHDGDRDGLQTELHQLAGVAIAWATALNPNP